MIYIQTQRSLLLVLINLLTLKTVMGQLEQEDVFLRDHEYNLQDKIARDHLIPGDKLEIYPSTKTCARHDLLQGYGYLQMRQKIVSLPNGQAPVMYTNDDPLPSNPKLWSFFLSYVTFPNEVLSSGPTVHFLGQIWKREFRYAFEEFGTLLISVSFTVLTIVSLVFMPLIGIISFSGFQLIFDLFTCEPLFNLARVLYVKSEFRRMALQRKLLPEHDRSAKARIRPVRLPYILRKTDEEEFPQELEYLLEESKKAEMLQGHADSCDYELLTSSEDELFMTKSELATHLEQKARRLTQVKEDLETSEPGRRRRKNSAQPPSQDSIVTEFNALKVEVKDGRIEGLEPALLEAHRRGTLTIPPRNIKLPTSTQPLGKGLTYSTPGSGSRRSKGSLRTSSGVMDKGRPPSGPPKVLVTRRMSSLDMGSGPAVVHGVKSQPKGFRGPSKKRKDSLS